MLLNVRQTTLYQNVPFITAGPDGRPEVQTALFHDNCPLHHGFPAFVLLTLGGQRVPSGGDYPDHHIHP